MRRLSVFTGFVMVLGLIIALSVMGLLGVDPGAARAASLCVNPAGGACFTTIQAAVDAADDGDVINIAAGTYTEHVIVTKTLSFLGSGSGNTFVEGSSSGRVFSVTAASAAFSDLTIQNGLVISNNSGGGIYASGALTLTNVNVLSNTAQVSSEANGGGGVRVMGALLITGGRFENNYTPGTGHGGAIRGDAGASITGALFYSNTAGGRGGAVYVHDSAVNQRLSVANTQFISNTANSGGGIWSYATNTIDDSLFRNNLANPGWGGGLASYGVLTMTHTRFISNTAGQSSGGVYARMTTMVSSSLFMSNTGGITSGGGGLQSQQLATIIGSQFIHNTSGKHGGGVYGYTTMMVTDTQFIGNSAPNGGGVYLYGNEVGSSRFVNALFEANTAITNGAALYLYSNAGEGGTTTIIHTTIVSPTVGALPAIFVGKPSSSPVTATITNTIIASYTTGISLTAGVIVNSDYNLFFNAPTAIITGSHSITGTDPWFVNPLGGDYHLRVGSPAIDKGTNAGVTTDLDGNKRPQRAGYDIGAYEACYVFLPLVRK